MAKNPTYVRTGVCPIYILFFIDSVPSRIYPSKNINYCKTFKENSNHIITNLTQNII